MKLAGVVLMAAVLLSPLCYGQNHLPSSSPSSSRRKVSLVQNGDFSRGMASWLTIGQGINGYHPEDPGRADFGVENGIVRIDIENEGISIWSVMLYQFAQFEKGATYSVSFYARSDSKKEIIANVVQDKTWKNFSGDNRFKLTGAMQDYSYQFTMSESGPAAVQLCLGKTGTGAIYVSDFAVTRNPAPAGQAPAIMAGPSLLSR